MKIEFEDWIASPFVTGLIGGVLALRGVPGSTLRERLFNVFSAMMLAGFFSPAIAEFFGLHTPAMQSATAFAVGLFGLNLVAAVVEWIKALTLDDILPWRRKGE
jgi:hypothetical protein